MVDTCVWIDAAHGAIDLDSIYNIAGSELIYVSAITLGELEFGAQIPNDPRERAERTMLLRAVERMPVLEVTRGERLNRLACSPS